MDTAQSSPSGHEPNTRAEHALRLYEERGHEVERIAEGLYRVPSCIGAGSYRVRYGADVESCECPDHEIRGENCKHILCVGIAHAKKRFTTIRTISSAGDPFKAAAAERHKRARRMLAVLLSSCAECGTRDAEYFVTVPAGHLTFFEGDELCPECAANHGVL